MDNAQKAIMIGVGLFITIIVIAAVMLITGIGQDLLNSGTNQLGSITSGLDSSIIDQIDSQVGSRKSRTSAKALAEQILSLEGSKVIVKNGAESVTWTYGNSVLDSKFQAGHQYEVSGSFSSGITFTRI